MDYSTGVRYAPPRVVGTCESMSQRLERALSIEYGRNRRQRSQYSILNTLIIILLTMGFAPSVHAQGTATLQILTVSLLPQYDDPRLMIVFEAELNQAGTSAIAIPTAVELTG